MDYYVYVVGIKVPSCNKISVYDTWLGSNLVYRVVLSKGSQIIFNGVITP